MKNKEIKKSIIERKLTVIPRIDSLIACVFSTVNLKDFGKKDSLKEDSLKEDSLNSLNVSSVKKE